MVWQIGPEGPDPTPLNERPLDVVCFSRPVFRIVRYARGDTRGFVNLVETFRTMASIPNQILLVKSRHGKPQPRVNDAARKANVEIEIQSRPFQDDLLVTVLGPIEKKEKPKKAMPEEAKPAAAPIAPKPVTQPRVRCFGRMYPPSSIGIDIFS
jgi:hypothetical protein